MIYDFLTTGSCIVGGYSNALTTFDAPAALPYLARLVGTCHLLLPYRTEMGES